jgi:ribonuclease P/MRP protein subunit RPP40
MKYAVDKDSAPAYHYLGPDSLRDLGVLLSSDLSFSLQIEKVVSSASQMVGWGLRTFRGRSSYLLLTLFKSLVQPHLDYCSQLWSPSTQSSINKIEPVQKSLVSKISDSRLRGLNYWRKLKTLHLYSQECRRERYIVIFLWKIIQGLVSGYTIPFTSRSSRTGRKAEPAPVPQSAPAAVRNSRAGSLAVRGAQLFNPLPLQLRNNEHGDIPMFKNHMDTFLENIPDEPTVSGLVRESNSLIHQIPLYDLSFNRLYFCLGL